MSAKFRLYFYVSAFCMLHTAFLLAQSPAWWLARGAVAPNLAAQDYSPLTLGQLKWLAVNARDEMNAYFGAGTNITAVVDAFANTNNFYPANLGQLKYVAQPFYDRLYELNLTNTLPTNMPGRYPWGNSSSTNDYAPANIGQAKYVFSFDSSVDMDQDGRKDWEEAMYFALEVHSAHGSCIPAEGTNEYLRGSTVNCYIAESPSTQGGTQYVGVGWTGAGSIPASGTNLALTVILQTNSTIEWLWDTNYWLGLDAGEHGILSETSRWHQVGAIVNILAAADESWRFAGWSGDTSGLDTNANPLSVVMSSARNLNANFVASLPPDPADVAPPMRPGEVGILSRNMSFLYSGENPIQTGADTNAFDATRLGVVRGYIFDRAGAPLSGVTVTVSGRPEFGQTLSRLDGGYDLALNGGLAVTIDFLKDGYLPARRTIDTAWQQYSVLPEVHLIPADPVSTPVVFGAAATNMQVARSSVVTDQNGERQATAILPSGIQAFRVDAAGVTQAVELLSLRFTEYTVGSNGPACMPAELPASSFYTYCIELGTDEAEGQTIRFDRPVSFYVDNFLEMPVGLNVPAAYYEWKGCPGWVAEPDGVVLQIVGTNGLGQAEIDLDGDGVEEDAAALAEWGITSEECLELAKLYAPGKSLWRVQMEHFSPWDLNYPFYVAPEGAKYPEVKVLNDNKKIAHEFKVETGGSIGIESGTFNESLPIVGTGYKLDYTSARVVGHNQSLIITITGDEVPEELKRVDVEVSVAGKVFANAFSPLPHQTWNFVWDGKDACGRDINGEQRAVVSVVYVYDGFYGRTAPQYGGVTFATLGGLNIPGEILGRCEVTLRQSAEVALGGIDNRIFGFGGWMLDIHHAYDPVNQILYYGDGRESGLGTQPFLKCIRTVAGTGEADYIGDGGAAKNAALNQPKDICAAPDGTLYVADAENNVVRKVSPQGIITTVAGTGSAGYTGDNGYAINAELDHPVSVAVCAHGVLYISDSSNNVIRKVTPDGIIHTAAGTGAAGYSGDGGPAIIAQLNGPMGLAVDKECALYVADSGNLRVRRIGPDKRINTIAGTGAEEFDGFGDGGPAIDAAFLLPADVAVSDDGSLLIADLYDARVRRIGNDGIINTVYKASNGLFGCRAVAAKPGNSSFYVVEYMTAQLTCPAMVWEVLADGSSRRVAGIYDWEAPLGDGGLATAAYLDDAEGACFGPDGVLYVADTQQHRIRSVKLDYPGFGYDETAIASEAGDELYVFDAAGRHLRTLDAQTYSVHYAFDYTAGGLLASITDGDGLVATIERDSSGNPTAVVGPYGHRTEMALDFNGWLAELANPAGETNVMQYTANGLLTNVVSRRGYEFHQQYDSNGRIIGNADPAGGMNSLTHQTLANGWEVEVSDGLGRTNTHIVEHLEDGTDARRIIDAAGLEVGRTESLDGNITITAPDGSVVWMQKGPDPRFGMQSPIIKHREISTTWYSWNVTDYECIAGLSDPNDPLSLTNRIDYLTVNGRTWSSQYTGADRTAIGTTPMGKQSMVRTDALGRPVYMQSPGVYAVSNEYDTAGRLIKSVQGEGPEARALHFQYAADGTLRAVSNSLGEATWLFADLIGRLTNQVFADTNTLALAYDRSSSPVKCLLPHGTEHGFGYNPIGLTERYSAPAVESVPTNTLWRYNSARQMDYLIKPDGTIISNVYDSAGRLATVRATRNGEAEEIAYAYDEAGRLGSASRAGNAVQYGYDAFLLTEETTPAGIISREYNDDFLVTSLSLVGIMSVYYGYDDDGLLAQAGDISLTRDPASGFLTGLTLGNVTDTRNYNGFGEVNQYAAQYGGTDIYSVAYGYDALGRITNATDNVGGTTVIKGYAYDSRGRLTQVTTNGAVSEVYAYDPNGNRTNAIIAAVQRTAVFDAQDRMLTYGDLVCQYDANGNQTNRTANSQSSALSYDLFGQLASVTLPDGRQISYDRDALGRITAKRINGLIVKGWIYKNGLKPIAETDSSGNVVSVFVYGSSPLTPDYMTREGNTYRLIRDHVGSVRLVVDISTGNIIQRIDCDSFGNVLADTNPGFQPFGFQSGLYDNDTGFVQFGARWYDPVIGRWLGKDSLLLAAGLNVYTFCANDPVNLIDANGEQPIEAYDYWMGVAVEGQDAGGIFGNLQTTSASVMMAFIDFWGARNIQSQAELSGGAAGKGDSTQAWKHGFLAGGQIALSALSAFGGNNSVHPWIRYVGPNSFETYDAAGRILLGTWVTRAPSFGRNFIQAADALQLPHMPNDVVRVRGAWRQYISYEGRATAYPQFGAGGAPQWRVR